mmetsp:Transcript_46078/g.90833  ORF Transcript_46078/g.90833 Transcript_46078/m.90833 type:complete len:1198 (-) Transcript_46078:74-3667(-)
MPPSTESPAPVLNLRHTFGLRADVINNIHYIEDNLVLYPAGHNVVVYNCDTKTQRFIHGSDMNNAEKGPFEISCLAVSNDKKHVAVAEKGVEKGQVIIYSLETFKKKKTLSTADCHSKEYVSMCFSPDDKYLLTQGGGPDWVLINWLFSRSQPKQITRIETKDRFGLQKDHSLQCSYCPSDQSLIAVTGKGTLLYFRVEPLENTLKPVETSLTDRPTEHYLCHVWTTGKKMVVGTSTGNILYLENAMYRATLKSSPQDGRISAMAAIAKGFVVGSDNGVIRVFEEDPTEYYHLTRTFHVQDHPHRVNTIAISPSGENLSLTLADAQLYVLKMFDTDVLKAEDMKFEPLVEKFHTGAITGLDVCVRKPVIVTCAVDKTVRVWNYLTKAVELEQVFPDTPHSIAFHPSGLHVLIGFSDKLRLCNILMDDIRCFKEFPIKACCECQFSNGGQYFAAVNTGSNGKIHVYNTYTCELYTSLPGGNVRSLYWSLDDKSIISAGWDGAVHERRLDAPNIRTTDYTQKECKFSCALKTEDGKIYAVGDDRILKEIIDKTVNKQLNAEVVLTQLVVSHPPQRMMFAGTANGVVRSFKFPLTGIAKDYQCHSKGISRMRITQDDGYLITVSEDGLLAIFAIKEKDGRIAKKDRPEAVPFSEEILVTKTDLEEKNATMTELKSKVDELTASNEYHLRLHDMNYTEKLKEVSEKYNLQIQHDKSKIEMLRDEKQELEMEFDEKIAQLQTAHANRLHAEDLEQQKAIMKEVGLYQKLQEQMEADSKEYKKAMRERELRHNEEMARLRDKFEDELREERLQCKSVEKAKEIIIKEFQETKSQLEEDTDKEIEELKEKYDKKLHSERDHTLRLKGENGIMKKKFIALQKDIVDQGENIAEMKEEKNKLNVHIGVLEGKITVHKQEIEERDRTIGEKERHIYDLKKENQELEKFKFVLDYQIKELKRQIEPRENEIAEMKDKVMRMDGQLEAYHKENGQLQQEVKDSKVVLQKKQNMIRRQRQKYRKATGQLDSMANDLHHLVQVIQDPEKLKEGTKALYHNHVTERIQAAEVDPDVSKEYKRQRQYLERSVDVLKKKLTRDMKARKNDNMRVMQENVALIKEINKMRREIKLMHQVQRQKELNNNKSGVNNNWSLDQGWDEQEAYKILQMQRDQIESLRHQIEVTHSTMAGTMPPDTGVGYQDGSGTDEGAV